MADTALQTKEPANTLPAEVTRGVTYTPRVDILETEDEHVYDWKLFSYHWPLHGFGLKDRVLKKVYAENAAKILKRHRSALALIP